MKFVQRINKVPPYLFVEISRKLPKRKAEGVDVLGSGIENRIIHPPDPIIAKLLEPFLTPQIQLYPTTYD